MTVFIQAKTLDIYLTFILLIQLASLENVLLLLKENLHFC